MSNEWLGDMWPPSLPIIWWARHEQGSGKVEYLYASDILVVND